MPDSQPTVILTRPAESAAEFAALLGPGVRVIVAPILETRPVSATFDLDAYAALVVTSRAALAGFGPGDLAGRRVFAVGDATAARARALGAEALSAGGDGADLMQLITAHSPTGRLFYLRGREVARDVAEAAKRAGLETDSAIVYEQVARPLTEEATAALRTPGRVILPVFSPRSARLLGAAVGESQARAVLEIVAISARALDAWAGPAPAVAVVAARPDAAAMCDAVRARLAGDA